MKRMTLRHWISVISFVFIIILVVVAWPEIKEAFGYLTRVNLWVLSLLIPVQIGSYFVTGQVLFSYLQQRGHLQGFKPWNAARLSLEFNFVNHILPSGGAAGIAYTVWKLGQFGVSASNATMGQLVRFVLTFASFVILLAASLGSLVWAHEVTAIAVIVTVVVVVCAVAASVLLVVLASRRRRISWFAHQTARFVNAVVRFVTRGKTPQLVSLHVAEAFAHDIHHDYEVITVDPKVLVRPFLWAFVVNILDVALFWVTFTALGVQVNPGMLFIAYGLSTIMSIVVVTPGGTGMYETVMIAFLASAGVSADAAIAGTLLARVILLLSTIVFGYAFYQNTIMSAGEDPLKEQRGR